MSDIGTTVAPLTAVRRQRPALPVWPLFLMFGLLPLWWVLGAWYLIWPVFGLLLAAILLTRGKMLVPTGTPFWLAFLALVGLSATMIDRPTGYLTFGLRYGYMITAFMVGLYVYNLVREGVSWERVTRPLCIFWLSMVALGWLGVLMPTFTATSLVEAALPASISGERLIRSLTHLHFTEFNALGRNPIFRPAAPYAYTNNWGTGFSIFVPFVLAYLTSVRRGVMRVLLLVSLPLAVVPAFLTLNRGMFIGLGTGLGYLAIRALIRGQVKLVLPIFALVVVGWVIQLIIPVGQLIESRTSTTDSTRDRFDIYAQTLEWVAQSPFLGYGVSSTVDTTYAAEPLGTQGQVWQLMFSHGVPALICFFLLMFVVARRLAAAVTPAGQWLSTIPVIAVVITPFYGYTDPNMAVMFFGISLGLAAVDGPVNREVVGSAPAPRPAAAAQAPSRRIATVRLRPEIGAPIEHAQAGGPGR